MGVFQEQEFSSTVRHYSRIGFNALTIQKLCRETSLLLQNVHFAYSFADRALGNLKKNGQIFWDILLTRQVKARLQSAQPCDLTLAIDEYLVGIPWELLYDGNDFLCLKYNVGRVVKTQRESFSLQYRSASAPLRMLILANPTNDLPAAYREGIALKKQFDKRRKDIVIDVKTTLIDTFYLKKNIRDYDIVHFAGHGDYHANNFEENGWVLQDGKFTVRDIASMAQTGSLPNLVFSNACHSAQEKDGPLQDDCQEFTYSLASAFICAGVRHYIGAVHKIEDTTSMAFARNFYVHLLEGCSIGEGMRRARLGIAGESGMHISAWSSYLLYGNPSVIFFRTHKVAEHKRKAFPAAGLRKYVTRSVIALIGAGFVFMAMRLLPTHNPSVYASYQKSQEFLQQGRNHDAMTLLESILSKEQRFLSAYPLLAEGYSRQGESRKALQTYFDYALACEKKHDYKRLAEAYTGIGWRYQLLGEYPKALEFYQQALSVSREFKDALHEAVALRKLSLWHMDKEEYTQALELLTKSSEINRQRQRDASYRYNLACDYFDLGLLFVNKDDYATAKKFYDKSKRLFEQVSKKDELSDYYFNLGEIYSFEKHYQRALEAYQEGLKIDTRLDNKPGLVSDYTMIGDLYFAMDKTQEAEKYYLQGIALAEKIEAPLERASVYYAMGLLYKHIGKRNRALDYLRKAQEIYSRIDTPDYQCIKEDLMSLE
jgi:tetratricopeptide (TPR) repeat protein